MAGGSGALGENLIDDCIEKISSSNLRQRSKGLADFKEIFKNRRSHQVASITSKKYHTIYEELFKLLVDEKQSYLGASKPTKLLTRLTDASNALRISVEAGSPKLKKQVVRAIISHVIETLPNENGEFCSPISQDYLKTLRAVLAYKPHVENLQREHWEYVVEFCIHGINRHYEDGRESSLSRASSFVEESHASSRRSVSISQMKNPNSRNASLSTTTKNVEELLNCLLALVSAPNSPLLMHAYSITSSVMQVIRFAQAPFLNISHQMALSIINLVLGSIIAEQTNVCKDLAKELVPLIARLWPTKRDSAKDEMLSILLGVHLHLESVLDESLETDIRDLSEVIRLEYSKRISREQLQLEDLDLSTLERTATTTAPLSFLRLRAHNLRAERNWMLLRVLGILNRLSYLKGHSIEEEVEDGHPRKRRRLTQQIDDIIDDIKSIDTKKRLAALQALPFVLEITQLHENGLAELLKSLYALMMDKSSHLASWAMLGIASCTTQAAVHRDSRLFDWAQTWHVGGRLVTSSHHSRAACHLLHAVLAKGLVKYHDIAEHVSAIITSPELSGPAVLADSSLSFMTHLLHMRNVEMPGVSSSASQAVIRWIFSRWNPIDNIERNLATTSMQPIDFLNLLRSCLAMPRLKPPSYKTTPCTTIGQAWQRISGSNSTIRYLLLLEESAPISEQCSDCPAALEQHSLGSFVDTNPHTQTTRKIILELCLPKVETLVQYWETSDSDRPKQISTGAVSGTAFTFLVGSCVVSLLGSISNSSELRKHVESLADTVVSFTQGGGNDWRLHDENILQAIHPYLPSCQSLESACRPSWKDSPFLKFVHLYAAEIKNRGSATGAMSDDQSDDDLMPIEQDFNLHSSVEMPREELSLETNSNAFNYSTSAHVVLVSEFATLETISDCVPQVFFDYILSLQRSETLLCRNLLRDLLQSELVLSDDDAERLLLHCAEKILQDDDYSSCEIVHGICLDILIKTAATWMNDENQSGLLAELAAQVRQWFIKAALELHAVSSNTMVGIAALLFELIHLHLPLLESRLLEVLQHGDHRVNIYIGARLPEIFKLCVLNDHEKIIAEVVLNLPADPNCHEGIAIRMHALALLGSKWPTLIRRSVYYIFECPGKFPGCSDHAARCFAQLSTTLGLGSARELFHLFASQLLFTWLEDDPIDHMPFQIFGYETLLELVRDAQADIIALMMMRAQDEQIESVSTLLGVPVKSLIQQSFAKVMAYTTAYDLNPSQLEEGARILSGEVRLKKILGEPEYLEYIAIHFADIIALFFSTVDQESRVEKLFSRSQHLIDAGNTMDEIKRNGSSKIELPPNHQPTFRMKYLGEEIRQVCSRAQFEHSQIYTPTLVSFIARKLFNLIHPALGSLHACSVLRRVRVLVCISGPAALQGYPLEMLLQSLRPYLTDLECVEDAIGVLQYLFMHGLPYLSQTPSFVSGIALSILASLRVFLKSSQASTTQESQYEAVMVKTEEFHRWFGDYLKHYESPLMSKSSKASFQEIVHSAHSIRSAGNANFDSAESSLLINLLEDERSASPLLTRPSRDLAFTLLCTEFNQPDSYRDDILGSDEIATKYSAAIWNLCRNRSLSKNFLAWGAKVIGRAFVANGYIHEELLRESEMARIQELSESSEVLAQSSSSILRLLQALTLGNDHKEVGLAESTLRLILSTLERFEDQTELTECQQSLSESLCKSSSWGSFEIPLSDKPGYHVDPKVDSFSAEAITRKTWLEDLSIKLCLSVTSDVVVYSLPLVLQNVKGFAEQAFPFILHSVLSDQFDEKPTTKKDMSVALRHWLNCEDAKSRKNVKLLLNAILYLRSQPLPNENSHADRTKWLEVDYSDAARAAMRCNMFKTALLFVEISSAATTRTSRRSSAAKNPDSTELLLSIFRSIDDPDSFYGVPQDASLLSVLSQLEYENDGFKSLSFRGAQYDTNLRRKDPAAASDADSLVGALGVLGLDGLSHSLLSAKQTLGMSSESRESMFRTARKLEQWDIPVPEEASLNEAGTIYRAFQILNNAANRETITRAVDGGLRHSMQTLIGGSSNASALHASLQSLSILTEMHEVLSSNGSGNFEEILQRFEDRASWMDTGRFDDISHIISCRETLLSSLSHRQPLREIMKVGIVDTRLVEVRTTLLSSGISRAHGALQESLSSATYMTELIQSCEKIGLFVDAAVNLEAANALWELGEMTSSIGLLQELIKNTNLKSQHVAVGKANLLAKLGSQVSTARLEMPDQIITNYLQPALSALKGKDQEKNSGQVYHEFAAFCDNQLQDPDGLEDLQRLRKLREQKQNEVQEYTRLAKASTTESNRSTMLKHLSVAKQWYQLDNLEYTRLSDSRAGFLRQSLENYLLALVTSDAHDKDVLRFLAMWLEHSDLEIANNAVKHNLGKVPTRKFAPLMNQLTSRLLEQDEPFQKILSELVQSICKDHPYHGMYQIWAGTRTNINNKDETAIARLAAAKRLAGIFSQNPNTTSVWTAIHETSRAYCILASDDGSKIRGQKYKTSQKVPLKDSSAGRSFVNVLTRQKIPPPTLHVEIQASCDYSRLPIMYKIEPTIEIASGQSAPKVLTVVASNGRKYKQLVKGSTDDLRQDAIMEQVFAQVSTILQTNRSTRQRNLLIRTYKVIPLTPVAGIIEFVPNSIPLHNFVMPAHPRYNPKDISGNAARKIIHDAQAKSLSERIKAYRYVTERFHPIMRYFFIEKFDDPDDWFGKRLAYTRSTAANSMLGHILGLGDRHGHNILIDEKTGEAVHIDFGFAFETGRVLPVPETVPFRLTRDIVDGMGITGTEGVFRRCCEFTLSALRKESYSIMTVLDVLRYDPLYNWTVSPYRLAKQQNEQKVAANDTNTIANANGNPNGEYEDEGIKVGGKGKGALNGNEPAEADRALTVIRKKLAKTLSVEATVNDLITQATDERNLAVLFCGWSAYA